MKIVFIIAQLTNGGSEREVALFANELVSMGEEVHIICINDRNDDYNVDFRVIRHLFHSTHIKIPKIRGLCNEFLMAYFLYKIHADIVLPIYTPYNLAAFISGAKLIYVVRGNIYKEITNKIKICSMKFTCMFAHGIWIQLDEQRYYLPKYAQNKIFIVNNILDNRFLSIHRTKRDCIIRFISVGRLHPQKNFGLLIDAFYKLLNRTGNKLATLTIYGCSHNDFRWYEDDLRFKIRTYGLDNRVFLPGRVIDIEDQYENADAFVFSSDYEGCPNALMEAMAAGLPCISTDCSTGPSSLIDNGINGLLVPVSDVDLMSFAMESFIENPEYANRLGIAAKEKMKSWKSPYDQACLLLKNLYRICSIDI